MILGVVLRNFKIYKGLNYIPLSNGTNFCGLIGQNGIGKSSVLEALDCFFNNKVWNKNIDSGGETSYILPIFVLNKTFFGNSPYLGFIENYSNAIKSLLASEITVSISNTPNRRAIYKDIKKYYADTAFKDKMVLPICLNEFRTVDFGIFDEEIVLDKIQNEESKEIEKDKAEALDKFNGKKQHILEVLNQVYLQIIKDMTYVYIPKDIEPERFVKFETEEIQHLIGANLVDIVKNELSENEIRNISSNLRSFVDELSNKLPGYKFKIKDRERQPNLKSKDIYDLIITDFFTKRELHKENKGKNKDIPLANLSSGEKQQAIISLIYSIVTNYRNENKSLIVAIDEPETALHISLCYDQFEKLSVISEKCCQVLFSSHWYGFIPTITHGTIVNIVEEIEDGKGKHVGYLFDVYRYKEEIKIADRLNKGQLPIEISLKGINDLIQSMISSVINENYYNWLICEGSSDKVYLEEYLKDEINNHKLRIVPVGGAGEVEKVYQQLSFAFKDLKKNLKGKVFLLLDTDAEFHEFSTNTPGDYANFLTCKRIVNQEPKTVLVQNQQNPKSPKTDIEDALNGKAFCRALKKFNSDYLDFIKSDEEKEEIPSFYAMDLRPTEYKKLESFFSENNNQNKVEFAKAYVEELHADTYIIPSWITEIKNFYH